MEKYMLIFHGDPSKAPASPEEMQANMNKWMAWVDKLGKNNQYVSGEPLLPGGKLISGSSKKVVDGPYTEGKEIVGGYFIINAKDIEEAVTIAKECPDYEIGASVQVRQVMKMDM